jgi:A/G-specific adenine glycosylase
MNDRDIQVPFSERLLHWASSQHRPMPWKDEKNPYFIWLSEIILQQTKVEQGLPYFQNFAKTYPTISDLANAAEDDVMKLWQGLGYYSRARNLHATAKHIANNLNGVFPKTYEEILLLKGVGEYTAAAIASFAYNLPHAVVDGNVYRVIARMLDIQTPIDTTEGKKLFFSLANEWIDKAQAGKYNQAIMDFGATLCTPKTPNCKSCPFITDCQAFKNKTIDKRPVKSKKLIKKERHFHYLILNYKEKTWISKRSQKDIWQNLYEFPLIELNEKQDNSEVKKQELWQSLLSNIDFSITKISKPYFQTLTHRKITATFWEIELSVPISAKSFIETDKTNLKQFAFPNIIIQYLQDKSLYLNLF